MRHPLQTGSFVLLLLCASPGARGAAAREASEEKAVFLGAQGEVWVQSKGETRRLAAGPAALVAWSPAGDQVAYVERGDLYGQAPVVLRQVSADGKALAALSIPPGSLVDDVSLEWRDLRRLVWLDGNRVSLAGSFDPSNDVLAVADLAVGRVTNAYIGREHSWSPNRRHLAQVGWIPQSAPAEVRAHDRLQIDGRTVYPAAGEAKSAGRFEGPLLWAPDSLSLAFFEKRDGAYRLVFVTLAGAVRSFPWPGAAKAAPLAWSSGGDALLLHLEGAYVAVETETGKRVELPEGAALARFPAFAEGRRRHEKARSVRGSSPDWWPPQGLGSPSPAPGDPRKER